MNICKYFFSAMRYVASLVTLAGVLMSPFPLAADLLFDEETEKTLSKSDCAELVRMERLVSSVILTRRERRSRAAKLVASGAVPPGEIQLVSYAGKVDLQWDPHSVDLHREQAVRRRLYSAFLLAHLEQSPVRIQVTPFLPEWITDALDLQLRLNRQTRLLKENYDLPVLRAYAEWGRLPVSGVLITPKVSRGGSAERRCRAEFGFLLLTALQSEPGVLKNYLLACRRGSGDPAQRFEKLIYQPLVKRFEPPKKGEPPPAEQLEKALLVLAEKLAWTPVGSRPAANVQLQLQHDLAEVVLWRDGAVRQRCPLRSLPGLLPTIPAEQQQKVRQELSQTVQQAVRGASRPLRRAAADFQKALRSLPAERKDGDDELFRQAEKEFCQTRDALLAVAGREAAIEALLDRVMAEQENLPFRTGGFSREFRLGEPLDRTTEQFLRQTEERYQLQAE